MNRNNSISLFTKQFYIERNIIHSPYSGLSWEETELLYTSLLKDTIDLYLQIPNTDIILFYNKAELDINKIPDIKNKVLLVEIKEKDKNNKLGYAIDYLASAEYINHILYFNYYPIIDNTFYNNILYWLSDEQDFIFIGPSSDLTLGMLAIQSKNLRILKQYKIKDGFENENLVACISDYKINVITTMTMPALKNVTDIIELKKHIEKLLKQKSPYPKNTYDLLKSFEKKSKLNNNKNEIRNIRRYF